MTLTSEINRVQYSGTGAQIVFPITFVFWLDADIKAVHTDAAGTETDWVEGAHYTLTGGSGATGTLTVATSPTDYTPASGETLTITSNLDDTQDTSLPEGGAFPSSSVEQQLDKIVRLIQQKAEQLGRALKLPVSSVNTDIEIPDPSASKFLRWNAGATALENADVSGAGSIGVPVSIAEGGTNSTTAAAARTALGIDGASGNIASGDIAADAVTGAKISSDVAQLGKNLVINGAMQVAQRGTSFATLTATQYTLDRWEWIDSGTTAGAVTITQDTDVPTVAQAGTKFMNSLKIDVTTAEDIASGDAALYLSHKIEARDCTRFGHGATGAQSGRLSFWFKSTKTGIFAVNLDRNDATKKFSTEFTVGTADTWEFHEVTIPGDTGGTAIADDSGIGLALQFMMAVGATGKTSTANAWNASGATELATANQVNLLDNAANNVFITGVQFEVGSNTTDFEHTSYADQFRRCSRYLQQWNDSGGVSGIIASGYADSTTTAFIVLHLRQSMRNTPTLAVSAVGDFSVLEQGSTNNATSNVVLNNVNDEFSDVMFTATTTGIVAGDGVHFRFDGGSGRTFALNAEL